ncbi:unnamed protein product [Dicrocoelium dendriticum]|nr:unnamed protein product [Dicrocoelium dendriticum]
MQAFFGLAILCLLDLQTSNSVATEKVAQYFTSTVPTFKTEESNSTLMKENNAKYSRETESSDELRTEKRFIPLVALLGAILPVALPLLAKGVKWVASKFFGPKEPPNEPVTEIEDMSENSKLALTDRLRKSDQFHFEAEGRNQPLQNAQYRRFMHPTLFSPQRFQYQRPQRYRFRPSYAQWRY